MPRSERPEGRRVLVCAPFGRDAESMSSVLSRANYEVRTYLTISAVADALDDEAGVILLTEESLRPGLDGLGAALDRQPAWSDVPLVLLITTRSGQRDAEAARRALPKFLGDAVILERPLGFASLSSALTASMRARQKQFEMRDRLAEIDAQYRRLDALLENLPVGVAFVGLDRSTVVANAAYRRFTGTATATDAVWEGFDSEGRRLTPEDAPLSRALRGDTVPAVEYRFRPPADAPIWTRISASPLQDAAGRLAGALAVIVDIDGEKRAQRQLSQAAEFLEHKVQARTADLEATLAQLKAETEQRERAEASLRQSQKMEAIGQLTGGIAHDFNNMLTGVIGSLDLMKRRIATGRLDGLERYMDAAATSAQRAASLTARLLAFSRRQSLDAKPLDTNALVLGLEDLIRRTLSESIALRIVPHADAPFAVADANQLENALLNLVINARDAMPDGGTLTLETNSVLIDEATAAAKPGSNAGRFAAIAVSDTGVGMTADVLEKVFDPFFTTKPLGQGTGLGLSMVYGFAKQSGGQVRIHSQPGEGTSVTLFLPLADGEATRLAEAVPRTEAPAGHGQHVLVVEDDASVRLLVKEVLDEIGYSAIIASDPLVAATILASPEPIDLLITDVGLPGMNGRQLAEIARQHRADMPILFITGYAENAAVRSTFLGPNMAMVTKPFALDALASKIVEMLG